MASRNNNHVFSSQSLPRNEWETFHSLLNIITPPQLRKSDLLLTRAESHCSLFFFFFWLGVKGTIVSALLHSWMQNSSVQCSVEFSSLDAPRLPYADEPWTPVHVLLFLVKPPRHEDARNLQKFPMAHQACGRRTDLSVFTPPSNSPFCQALKWQSKVGRVSITLGNSLFFPLALYT